MAAREGNSGARHPPEHIGLVHSALRDSAQVLRRHRLLQVRDAHLRAQAHRARRALLLREYLFNLLTNIYFNQLVKLFIITIQNTD